LDCTRREARRVVELNRRSRGGARPRRCRPGQRKTCSPLPADDFDRLRHKRRMDIVSRRDLLHDAAHRDQPVGRAEHAACRKIEFVVVRRRVRGARSGRRCPLISSAAAIAVRASSRDRRASSRSTNRRRPCASWACRRFALEEIELDFKRVLTSRNTSSASSRTRLSVLRGQPSNGVPSGIAMSHSMRASARRISIVHGKIANVAGSGRSNMSSSSRDEPSIERRRRDARSSRVPTR